MLQQHPSRAAKKVQADSCDENWRLVGCSSSSGEEDKSTSQEAEIEELRERVELFREHRGAAGQEEQSGSARKGSGLQEDLVVKVEEEFENGENKRKLDEQRKRLQK